MSVKLNRVKKLLPKVLLSGALASAMFLSIVGCQAKNDKMGSDAKAAGQAKTEMSAPAGDKMASDAKGSDKMASDMKGSDKMGSDKMGSDKMGAEQSKMDNIGQFSTEDLDRQPVTQDVFKSNKLTLVNVLSSTCGPCMHELPELGALSEELKAKGVGILGVNVDMDAAGKPDEESRTAMSEVLKKVKHSMKVVFMDQNLAQRLLPKVAALPYTFFVDQNGNIVGENYLGARSKDDWKNVIEQELSRLQAK